MASAGKTLSASAGPEPPASRGESRDEGCLTPRTIGGTGVILTGIARSGATNGSFQSPLFANWEPFQL